MDDLRANSVQGNCHDTILRRIGSCMRRCVSFALKPGKSIGRELKRIARRELGSASERLLQRSSVDDVHEGRKSVKKVEALASLLDRLGFAPPRKDVERLHAAKAALSRLRD